MESSSILAYECNSRASSSRNGLRYVFRQTKSNLVGVIEMSFLDKAKKKAEEAAKKAAEATKKAGEKGVEGAKKVGEKVKEAGEKGVDETKKAAHKVKEKID